MDNTAIDGPYDVKTTEHLWISMPDGTRLAARLWLPDVAAKTPVPALFEYIPYRKADMVRARDERNHPYFASHGYACLRIDMRGSGDSDGHMPDMYADAELSDARDVISWIAAQPWCNGAVGMFGTSWGGTASLQANLDAPGPLKAIIAVCATHDRYEDDIHHMGGCLLTDTFEWGATLPAILGAPPTPESGPDWQDRWLARLNSLSFPVEHWVREEARGVYWRHGSVIHQPHRLSRPILAVGGWSDRYSNSVMSLVSSRPDLVWGVVGPWGHHYPDQGHPRPAMGFQQLALTWWDHWLKPAPKPLDWPRLRVWLREFEQPADAIDTRNGHWVESRAPEEETQTKTFHINERTLSRQTSESDLKWDVPFDLRVGRAAGDTGYFGRFGGLPLDQQEDDALSLTFESEPLKEDIVLYGVAVAHLQLSSDAPKMQVVLRLNDVAPDGTTSRVAFCVRNLALDEQLDAPNAAPNDTNHEHKIPFQTMAYRFRKGHRIRLSISSSYWPIIWPAPGQEKLALTGATLSLPIANGMLNELKEPLPPALNLPIRNTHQTLSNPQLQRGQHETEDGHLINTWAQPFTEALCTETNTAFGYETMAKHSIVQDDPNSASTTFDHHARYTRSDGVADIRSTLLASCDATTFYLTGELTASWNDEEIARRVWTTHTPRHFG